MNPYDADLGRTPANHRPLTPVHVLPRTAASYPDRTAIVHGAIRRTYAEFEARARRLASALAGRGYGPGDTVSVMLPNVPAMLDAHFGVPMSGAVLHSINTRLDAGVIGFMLRHAESKVVICDPEFVPTMREALRLSGTSPLLVDAEDPEYTGTRDRLGDLTLEALLAEGDPAAPYPGPADEWDAIALNYTSGTTGDPKGVVTHHRGAFLAAMSNVLVAGMAGGGAPPVYLWTLPMFHCDGWTYPWTVTLVGGTHVCLRAVRGPAMRELIAREEVTHLCGAPIVMSALLGAPPAAGEGTEPAAPASKPKVRFITAGAPPPEAVLAGMDAAGFDVVHVYGLTETYGPATVNEWDPAADSLPPSERAALKARQGVRYPALEALDVLDPDAMTPVPADGTTLGEVMFAGNMVMKGYLKNPRATAAAFAGGWFRSGDLGVKHPDGSVQLKDRSKDIIISGGENVSSIEVEDELYKHPAVGAAAVVAKPDETWGETPCAFVELREGMSATEAELIDWCRARMARFKAPRRIVFGELPKTSTGKIQKFVLRERAKAG